MIAMRTLTAFVPALLLPFVLGSCLLDSKGTLGADAGPDASTCPAGQERCGSQCVDTQTDRLNCGRCGATCDALRGCVDGRCQCTPPLIECDGACVDTTTDRAHCGDCDVTCPAQMECRDGRCRCSDGTTMCDGQCVDTDSDNDNCGECGVVCAAPMVCNGAGRCEASCSAGFELCTAADGSPYCADLDSDPDNCGACRTPCPARAHARATCRDSTCGFECDPDYIDLDGSVDTGCECVVGVEGCDGLDNDCDGAADEGFDCAVGTLEVCDETGEGCAGTRVCDASCHWGACADGCPAEAPDCCDGACFDLAVDHERCGACDRGCGASQHCCGRDCHECCADAHCDDGEPCTDDRCVPETFLCEHVANAGSTDCAGVCCDGVCRVGGTCCDDSGCTGPSCGGDPRSCYRYDDEGSCRDQEGCDWQWWPFVDWVCVGTPWPCADMPTRCAGCGCVADAATGACGGDPFGCDAASGEAACGACGCSWSWWGSDCNGSPSECSRYSCASQEGCTWNEVSRCVDYACR
jgi:hypothetical protein